MIAATAMSYGQVPRSYDQKTVRTITRQIACILFVGRQAVHNDPVAHVHDAVGVGGGFRIVRDHDDGLSQLLVQLTQHLQHNFRIPGVQVAGGLIRQDDLGLVDDGASDGHALLFPAGKLGRAMAQAIAQTEHLGDHLEAVRIKAVAVDVLGNGDVAESVESGRSEEHTSELQSPCNLVCRLLLEKKKKNKVDIITRIYIAMSSI